MEITVVEGLRFLLGCRVSEAEVEPTLQRILDITGRGGSKDETAPQFAHRVRLAMDNIAPRPPQPTQPDVSPNQGALRKALIQCTAFERAVARERYQDGQSIEQIAANRRVPEREIRDVLRRVRRRVLPLNEIR